GRYRMLETVRQYAAERLKSGGTAPAIRRRHADYYLRIAQAARSGLRGPDQLAWAGDLAVDIDNFQAAVDSAVQESAVPHLLGIIEPPAVYSTAIGYAAMDWANTASSLLGACTHPKAPTVLSWAAWGAMMRGDRERAGFLADRADTMEATCGTR